MPSKGRWALNPRKWFGTISNAANKRAKGTQINNSVTPLPSTISTTTRTIPSTSAVPRLLTARNKTKVMPVSSTNNNNYINSVNTLASFTQLQLPAFNIRREQTSTLFSSSKSFYRTNTFLPAHIEPSIPKNGLVKEELSIDATRWHTETTLYDTSKSLLSSQYGNCSRQNSTEKQLELNTSNISNQCLVSYPQSSSNHFIKNCPSPTRSPSLSSVDDNDERDESSSSGIFTDERADLNDGHRTASKDTLSTVEVLSVESLGDSQTSLNHCQSRLSVYPYRLPLSTFETITNKSSQLQRQTPMVRSHRSHSAEDILNDTHINTPIMIKCRQSSAAIVKKIEKRMPTSRSPTNTLEKAGFVRISNATYRLTMDKDDHLYRRQRQNSIIQYSNYDDSLPSANSEESYATLPRTSSTEQLNNNIEHDIRAMVDDYLRPMMTLTDKKTDRSIKTHHRSKRSHTNHEYTQINIENITDKLLSSIDCSTYSQYQRCY